MSANLGGFISANFDPLSGKPTTVEYLVVAGGGAGLGAGAGGGWGGGGGGAGGFLTATNFDVTAGANNIITVGAGGAGSTDGNASAASGGDSAFSSIKAIGGGGAGGWTAFVGVSGGSGGGAVGYGINSGGAGTAGQGNAGGNNPVAGYADYAGPCGGGAGSPAIDFVYLTRIAMPGTGLCSSITGSRVFYAGGGQGSFGNHYNPISVAGGGSGQITGFYATSAIANSGSGGGGNTSSGPPGGSGGSGIVVIRYPATQSAPTSTTGSPQINYADGYQIYIFTSSGTITF